MIELLPVLVPGLFVALAVLIILYRKVYGVRGRTAAEVLPYLRHVDVEELRHLFSAKAELYMSLNFTPRQFRREQRHRMILALEYIRRICHNVRILQEWATYELRRARAAANRDCANLSLDLTRDAVNCRMCSFALRTRLHTWLVRMAFLPFLAPPSFEELIRFGSVDLLDFYNKVRSSASELGRCYGDGHQQKLAEFL